jgi:tetratricopeptide (TPR) repeat protein
MIVRLQGRGPRVALLVLCLLVAANHAFPQTAGLNYNTYYRFPLSVGVEYQSLSPFAAYGSQYNIFDLSVQMRWPIPPLPVLQPTLKAGMLRFDSQDVSEPLKWDHTHWYGALGLNAAHRFSKNFELGGEALVGLSEAVFQDLLAEPVGTPNLFIEAGARIALNPSYAFSIDVHPSLKYLVSLSPLSDFNGFIFSIGFAGHFRFGQDPDAPGSVIRSIRFDAQPIPPVFAAMQSYYVKHPIGSITITNTDKQSVMDATVSFFQAGYMDSQTPAASIAELEPGESRKVDLFASFNEGVFRTEGVTPLTGEVIVSYSSKGRAVEQRQSVSYDLYDKTAVTWDDDRKVAAFITPADGALRNYTSFIRQVCRDQALPEYSDALQLAIQVFTALGEIGCLYQADPSLPFTKVQDNPVVVDSISLPRDTLKRITGDCDDLTVLYCSLLETAGVETGFITVPGHIYAAFNTKIPSRDFARLHPDRGMTIGLDGELWVAVEITMIGKTGFLEAWRKGTEEWAAFDNNPEKRGLFKTRQCQELYRPVGLRETDLGLQYGRAENILGGFRKDLDKLVDALTEDARSKVRASGAKQEYNKLGVLYAQLKRYSQAEEAFNQALKLDAAYQSAGINLANVQFLKGNFAAALTRFLAVYQGMERKGEGVSTLGLKVLINISKTCYQMARYPEAQQYFEKARAINPEQVKEFAYLAERGTDGARAAEGKDPALEILFVED